MEKRSRKVQYLVTLSISTAAMMMGVASGWATPVLPKFDIGKTSVDANKDEISWMLSIGPLGFIVGSLLTGCIIDRFGRRALILWSALPYSLGTILAVTAVKAWMLYFMQFFWQIGSGILSNVMMAYLSEISDKEIRGTLNLVTRIAFNFGTLLIMCIGPYVAYDTLNKLLLVLPVIFLGSCWWIPESPHYYLKDEKVEPARKSLMKLRGYTNEKDLDEELNQLHASIRCEMRQSTTVKELFTGKQYRDAIVIATGLKVFAIMTGIQTVTNYFGLIMRASRIHIENSTTVLIFGIIKFLVSVMPSLLVDKIGRRPLLIWSYLGTALSLSVVCTYFSLKCSGKTEIETLSTYGIVTLLAIILANIISAMGYNSLVTLIPGEIFPMNVKAVALSSLGVFSGIIGSITTKLYQPLKDCIGIGGVFLIYTMTAIFGAVFSLLIVPETKGKSMKEIQILLQGNIYNDDVTNQLEKVEVTKEQELEELNKKETS